MYGENEINSFCARAVKGQTPLVLVKQTYLILLKEIVAPVDLILLLAEYSLNYGDTRRHFPVVLNWTFPRRKNNSIDHRIHKRSEIPDTFPKLGTVVSENFLTKTART